jgi:hypothetical protein
MNLASWQTSKDPGEMLAALPGKVSERKLRLFACACCRRAWHLLPEEPSRRAVEIAESHADGATTAEELAQARAAARQVTWGRIQQVHSLASTSCVSQNARSAWALVWAACAAEEAADAHVWSEWTPGVGQEVNPSQSLALRTAQVVSWAKTVAEEQGLWSKDGLPSLRNFDDEEDYQCELLRDVFGSVICPVWIDPKWLSFRSGTVARMALAIHEEARFEDLPILADALEDAGCDSTRLLDHCRSSGPHVRGCWAVDALLRRD